MKLKATFIWFNTIYIISFTYKVIPSDNLEITTINILTNYNLACFRSSNKLYYYITILS